MIDFVKANEPAEAVKNTSAALMVPVPELLKLPPLVATVKLVPAPDAPEMLVAVELLMFTNCPPLFALAMRFGPETDTAAPPVPTLPAVAVKVTVVVEARTPVVVRLLAAVTVSAPAVDANPVLVTLPLPEMLAMPLVPLMASTPVLESHAVPVPFNVMAEAAVASGPDRLEFSTLPEPVAKLIVVPVSVPPA